MPYSSSLDRKKYVKPTFSRRKEAQLNLVKVNFEMFTNVVSLPGLYIERNTDNGLWNEFHQILSYSNSAVLHNFITKEKK